ncbi:MAG: trehalose-phosphatase [Anaerolineae bacterium]
MTARSAIPLPLLNARQVRLFLDYDGTLADFAPTPDVVEPRPEVIEILTRLRDTPDIHVSLISGRRLSHLETLVPVSGVLLAGTYGVELRTPSGERRERLNYAALRPLLDALKPRWADLIADREGFYLEDKGWSLALHARYAADAEAVTVLRAARRAARAAAAESPFHLVGGHKFLELRPHLAHKGKTVAYLLQTYPLPDALPVYVGDDDKDAEAFDVIHAHGGLTVFVTEGQTPPGVAADLRLPDPQAVHAWLRRLLHQRGRETHNAPQK